MSTVKELVSRVQLDDDFSTTGRLTVPPNAAAIFIIPADGEGGFATAAIQRWTDEFPDAAKNFYYAVMIGTMDVIANDLEDILERAQAPTTEIRALSNLDDVEPVEDTTVADESTMSISNVVEFGKPTIKMSPPKVVDASCDIKDVEPQGTA